MKAIIAGPGCGKTTTLLKIANMLDKPFQILTFSRKTAIDIRKRTPSVQVNTFHSLAYKILKQRYNIPILISEDATACDAVIMSYDDLLINCIPHIKEFVYKYGLYYLLVDEFQDIDIAQFNICKQFARCKVDIIAVGDPDQSIYSWRGNLKDAFGKLETLGKVEFEYQKFSYRLPQEICKCANSLIANNYDELINPLSSLYRPCSIDIKIFPTDFEMHEYIDTFIERDSAVALFRTNARRRAFTEATGRIELTKDDPDVLYIANLIQSGIVAAAVDKPDMLWRAIPENIRIDYDFFIKFFKHLYVRADQACAMIEFIEMFCMPNPNICKAFKAEIHKLDTILTACIENELPFIDEFSSTAKAMTLHASKGMEFDNVIIDCRADSIPCGYDIVEERRLMYVGITRAKKNLTLCSCIKTEGSNYVSYTPISYFVAEMYGITPMELLKVINYNSYMFETISSEPEEERKSKNGTRSYYQV